MLGRVLVQLVVYLLVMEFLEWLLPSFHNAPLITDIAALLLLSLLNTFLRPILVRLTLPVNVLTFGIFTLILNGLIFLIVDLLLPRFAVGGLGTAIFVTFTLTMVGVVLESVLYSEEDQELHEYNRIKRLIGKRANQVKGGRPGLILLEIDGLSEPVMRRAIEAGHMPRIANWIKSGTYQLVGWDSGLPAQTSAMQAGILHGTHRDIPAFRWYDKNLKRLLVSGTPKDAAIMLKAVEDGNGILRDNGFSLNNWAYGDAHSVVLTMSTMSEAGQGLKVQANDMYTFFASPDTLPIVLVGMVKDLILEYRQARYQRTHNVLPRVHRGGVYPFMRIATTVLLPTLSRYLMITKMFEGVSAAYTTFVNYDEVAHHSGIERPDALLVLDDLDKTMSWIANAANQTGRPYEIVLLSDHGQSQGATFKQRYGMGLEDLVKSLFNDPEHVVSAISAGDTGAPSVNAFLTTAAHGDHLLAKPVRALLGSRTRDGFVDVTGEAGGDVQEAAKSAQTIVCASGNLGLISFTELPGRVTLEQMNAAFPGFLEGLVAHEGIGFVLVRSEEKGGLVIGEQGIYSLTTDSYEGDNPLEVFGPYAAEALRELDSYSNVPDVVVNSFYIPETGEVAAFEELVGSHGGLGGPQNRPFLLYPTHLQPEGLPELVGTTSINRVLRGWLDELQPPPEGDGVPVAEGSIGAGSLPLPVSSMPSLQNTSTNGQHPVSSTQPPARGQ
ncbi:MAG: phage holin family protein [Chloroflexia bacterium]